MKIVKMSLSELKRPERNIRMHTERQLVEFERSVRMFGQIRPIVVDEKNEILAGNGLYDTLLRMGWKDADVYQVTGLSENQKKKLMIADNKVYGLGIDDLESFDAFLLELKDDLDIPGFDADLLQSMVTEAEGITQKLKEYGTLNDDEIAEIKGARERKEQYIQKVTVSESATGTEEKRQHADDEPIVCPKCGEKIWL